MANSGATAARSAAQVRPKSERSWAVAVLILLLLGGLPAAVWLDLRQLSERMLRDQADDFSAAVSNIRDYYARNVVGRVLAAHGAAQVAPNYFDIPGAIPIPATLSIELGQVISAEHGGVSYRFFSDFPFAGRAPHPFDEFERAALTSLRQDPHRTIHETTGSIFGGRVRTVTPIIMGGECVACHNAHPDSPKRDWKVGDVRGIQEITVERPLAANIFAFRNLLIYFVCAAILGIAFILMQNRQSATIRRINAELETANRFLATVSAKIARYLSPQLYRSIFSGERDVVIATERKRLTILFSDLVDFTGLTERLQPEELTRLLNEYFTEMSAVALKHGGTIDKFIGDAMVVFFGDPESKGAAEDAKACLKMALEMQSRLRALNTRWHGEGIELPILARMGINTGYCNVGNFGSEDRMDYTIIGAEANLAARLQSIAEPGGIVLGYETYALVRAQIRARPLTAITMKGIAGPIVPYAVEGAAGEAGAASAVISQRAAGLDLFLDPSLADRETLDRVIEMLRAAIEAQAPRRRA
jgi:class 3 adenylate cyclase